MKAKSLLILLLFTLAGSLSHALDLDQVFGHDDPAFIRQYNERFFKWFLARNPALQKCFSEQDQKELIKALQGWSDWGEIYKSEKSGDRQLLLNFEAFYEQKGPSAKLAQGIRFRWPRYKAYSFRGKKSGGNIWGAEVSSESCKMSLLKFEKKAGTESLLRENGERISLQLADGVKGSYYFGGLVKNSFPIYRDTDRVGEILCLESYNLLIFSPGFFSIAVAHEKEFHQLALRMRWKSKDEYSVYYP